MRVGIINYGIGNLGSVARALEELGATPHVLAHPDQMIDADRLILPGVGSFTHCKSMLDQGGWTSALCEQVSNLKKPVLGICLGMQLLADWGTEGAPDGERTRGLGFIPGEVRSMSAMGCKARIPHVGWNDIKIARPASVLRHISSGTDFYFVHSYAFDALNSEDVAATVEIDRPITAVVSRGHVAGTQFHPEKSSRAGLMVLQNFIEVESC